MVRMDSKKMQECAELCHQCQDACLRTIVHCLELGGEHATKHHQTMLLDCATICGASHSLLHRESTLHQHTCRACSEICRACADQCDRLAGIDQQMLECAKVCRWCAESCGRMAQEAQSGT